MMKKGGLRINLCVAFVKWAFHSARKVLISACLCRSASRLAVHFKSSLNLPFSAWRCCFPLNPTFNILYIHAIILDWPIPMPAPVLLFISAHLMGYELWLNDSWSAVSLSCSWEWANHNDNDEKKKKTLQVRKAIFLRLHFLCCL